jgi:hypothetical protein
MFKKRRRSLHILWACFPHKCPNTTLKTRRSGRTHVCEATDPFLLKHHLATSMRDRCNRLSSKAYNKETMSVVPSSSQVLKISKADDQKCYEESVLPSLQMSVSKNGIDTNYVLCRLLSSQNPEYKKWHHGESCLTKVHSCDFKNPWRTGEWAEGATQPGR